MVVFNIETKMWEHVMTEPEMNYALTTSNACAVMADKIYTKAFYSSHVYEPKESKWQTEYMLNSKYWGNSCVVDDVLYYHDRVTNTLSA